jgi:hypothetical protein
MRSFVFGSWEVVMSDDTILDDIHELSLNFVCFSLYFVDRLTNVVAHNCTKFAFTNEMSHVVCPQFLVHGIVC